MKLPLTLAVLAVGAVCANAQLPSGIGVRGGYFYGDRFDTLPPGSRGRLEGFEVGLDLSLLKLPLVEIRLSPTATFGGTTRSGGDTDGNIFRAVLNAKFNAPSQPWYVAVGSGFAFTDNRGGNQFDTTSGAVGQFTLGYEGKGVLKFQPYYELSWVFGESQLSGVSFDIGFRF
jgi:hypothetical protein